MKVALFARSSIHRLHIELQLEKLQQWAKDNAHQPEVFECYHPKTSPDARAFLAWLEKKKCTHVLVLSVCNLAASFKDVLDLLESLQAHNIVCWQLHGTKTVPIAYDPSLRFWQLVTETLEMERAKKRLGRMKENGTSPGRKRKELDLQRYQELQKIGKSRRKAASILGISPSTLYRRVKEKGTRDNSEGKNEK